MIRIKLPTNDHESHNCKTTSGLEFHKKVFRLATFLTALRSNLLHVLSERLQKPNKKPNYQPERVVIRAAPSSGPVFAHVSVTVKNEASYQLETLCRKFQTFPVYLDGVERKRKGSGMRMCVNVLKRARTTVVYLCVCPPPARLCVSEHV